MRWSTLRLCVAIVLLICGGVRGEVTEFTVLPSATDPAITTFDSPHGVYADRGIAVDREPGRPADRGELLVWLTGTGGTAARAARGFCQLAASNGYRVISLMYPNEIPATVCRNDEDPRAFEVFRMAVIEGGESPHITVSRADSIENRLIKLLQTLASKRAREGWGQFLTEDGGVKWSSVAVAGQSQGGGHAALLGIKHKLARVICTGAPKDYSLRHRAPAAWLSLPSATPKSRFFAFNHVQDPKGASPEQMLENLRSLGLTALGAPVDVSVHAPPYNGTRILTTSWTAVTVTGPNSEGAKAAHTSVIDTRHAERWKDVWRYMLTAE